MQAAADASAEAGAAAAAWGVEAAVVRGEVMRLETELTESEARRHRELGACARAAASRVEEMAEAVERAERRVASVMAENEEMGAERAAMQVRLSPGREGNGDVQLCGVEGGEVCGETRCKSADARKVGPGGRADAGWMG
jgi:hypothetical protein